MAEQKGGPMRLDDRELRQFVRVIMPELYKMQAAWDEWTDATARLSERVNAHDGSDGTTREQSSGTVSDRSEEFS